MTTSDDESADRERAFAYFSEGIVPTIRVRPGSFHWFESSSDDHERIHYILVHSGLMERHGQDAFTPTALGKRASYQLEIAKVALGLNEQPARTPSSITLNNHGPVGAINTGAGGAAHGTVNVSGVDGAMHKLVELQDELAAHSDDLWKILRRLREVETNQQGLDALNAAVDDLEVKAFVDGLRGEKQRLVLGLLKEAAPQLLKLIALPGCPQ